MNTDLQDKYDQHLGNLIKQLPNTKYILEVTKCCNYSTFVLVNKRASLLDLYKEVSIWFECKTMNELYIISVETGEKQTIPMTDVIQLKDFINDKRMKPIYPVPNNVVYRIYLDDGHSHEHVH
jgi:hypothetical protein